MQSKEKNVLVDSNTGKERLASYIYEYLVHIGAPQAAETFIKEINWKKDIALGDPPGFLHAWWSVFWDLYSAAPDRRETYSSSNEAKAYHDYGFSSSNYSMRSNNPETSNFRSLTSDNNPSMFGTNSFSRPPLPLSLRPPLRSPSFHPGYPCNTRSNMIRQPIGGEYSMQRQMPQPNNVPNPPNNYNKPQSSRIGLRHPASFADLGKNYEGNYRFPPLYPTANIRTNQGYSRMRQEGHHQQTEDINELLSKYSFPTNNYSDIRRQYRPPGQSKVHNSNLSSNRDCYYANLKPLNEVNDNDNLPNYGLTSTIPAQKGMNENYFKNLRSPISEANSPRDDCSKFSDFSLADYRRFLENDNSETEAIMKIKESMQEEAKKFEKDSEPPISYIQLS